MLDPRDSLRLLVIGAGKMGRAHIEAFRALPQVDIVGIASRSGDSAKKLASEFDIPQASSSWRDLAEQTVPDACVVSVSHAVNEAITREALEHGLHVLAEKPVAFSSAAVEELAKLARERGRVAMAAVNRRFYPSVLAAVEAVRYAGALHGITAFAPDPIRRRQSQGKHQPFVYERWTLAQTVHLIDLLRLAAGELVEVIGTSQTRGSDGESNASAMMRFSCGAIVHYLAFSSSGAGWQLHLHGDSVEARLAPLERGTLRFGGGSTQALPDAEKVGRGDIKPGLLDQAAAFTEAVRLGRGDFYPCSDLADHARSVALAERLERLMFPERPGPG